MENDAIDYLTKYINNNYELNNYLKAYYDDDKTISIFKYHYITSKELIFKYQIISFSDPILNYPIV